MVSCDHIWLLHCLFLGHTYQAVLSISFVVEDTSWGLIWCESGPLNIRQISSFGTSRDLSDAYSAQNTNKIRWYCENQDQIFQLRCWSSPPDAAAARSAPLFCSHRHPIHPKLASIYGCNLILKQPQFASMNERSCKINYIANGMRCVRIYTSFIITMI